MIIPTLHRSQQGTLVTRKCPAYIFWVKCLPCSVCQNTEGITAHHEVGTKKRGAAYKSNDARTMPLCHDHHSALHTLGHESWEHYYGLQAMHIARTQQMAMALGGFRIRGVDIDMGEVPIGH